MRSRSRVALPRKSRRALLPATNAIVPTRKPSRTRFMAAQAWKTQDVDPRIRTAPAVITLFTILRDGTIRDIRVKTSSGNTALDRSAERALYEVAKVDPLPAGYDRDKVEIEFWFELKR